MLLVAGCFLLFQTAGAQDRKHNHTTMSIDGDKKITDCSQIRMRIRGGEAITSQLVQVSPRSASVLEALAGPSTVYSRYCKFYYHKTSSCFSPVYQEQKLAADFIKGFPPGQNPN